MVRVIRTADVVGEYHGEDGADGWTYIPPTKKEEPQPKPRARKKKPQDVQPTQQAQALLGGTSLLKGKP